MKKFDLCRIVKNTKLPLEKKEEIFNRLSRYPRVKALDRLLASEDPTNIRRAGVVSGLQEAKTLFSLDSLGIGKPTKTNSNGRERV